MRIASPKVNFRRILLPMVMFFMLFVFSAIPVNAYGIWTCDQIGALKISFYDNETVYVTSGNITSTSQTVRVYIVTNNNSWVDGKALNDITETGYLTTTTNSSGHIPVTSVWTNPEVGTYDIVADVNRDGEYNSTYDFINSSSTTGLTILEAPIPTLHVETGSNSPASHDWDIGSDTGHNSMIQLKLSATIEDVRINSIAMTASGSGNDENDITVAYLILDGDGDGEYDQGEVLLSYSNYLFDNGVITFEIEDGYVVSTTDNINMAITYSMSSSGQAGNTYKFDVVSISAIGTGTSDTARVIGLPIGSAIKTISGTATTTTTTTVPGTTTTTIPTDECETDSDCGGITCTNKQKTAYSCEYDETRGINVCSSTIVTVSCCGDGDCVEGYYCLNYECVKETGGIGGWLGDGNYILTIVSIVFVIALVLIVFFIIKNRNKKPWKSKKEYEGEWESLRKKWGGKR